tara:strand:+ start:9711 stop:10148 length:438 start_codon:yes stop_codon:yes gene_type:complete
MIKKIIKHNSRVRLHYSLKGNDNIFESTFEHKPIILTIGECNLPQIIEASLYGLESGDKKEYTFTSKNIFGKFDKKKITKVPLNIFKNYKDVKPGDIIETVEDDRSFFMTVLELSGDDVLVDLNHPLSNKDIKFKIEILDIYNDS